MPTCVTPAAASQSRKTSRSRVTVRNVRTSLVGRSPGAPIRRHATTVSWCTSNPQHRSIITRIIASCHQKATATPQVLRDTATRAPRSRGDKEWYLYAARAGLLIGVANHRRDFQPQHDRPCRDWDKPARAAIVFIHNGAPSALVGCLDLTCPHFDGRDPRLRWPKATKAWSRFAPIGRERYACDQAPISARPTMTLLFAVISVAIRSTKVSTPSSLAVA